MARRSTVPIVLASMACAGSCGLSEMNSEPPAAHQSADEVNAETTQPSPTLPQPTARTQLVLLGTGTPNPDPERGGPALAIVVDGVAYLVDAGPGIVRRAQAAADAGVVALSAERLRRVFITHLHSDHTTGLPDLMLAPWVVGREGPLEVYGPTGIEQMLAHLHQAYAEDVQVRVQGLEGAGRRGHQTNAHVVSEGVVYEDERVRVSAFRVSHGSWRYAFGYRFDCPDRTIVVSGDTAPDDAVVRACNGCDLLVHEVFSDAGLRRRSTNSQAYHASFHTSASALGELATRARPGRLILYHQLPFGTPEAALVAEVRNHWSGAIAYGQDLDIF